MPIDPERIYAAGFSGGAMLAWALGRVTGGLAGVSFEELPPLSNLLSSGGASGAGVPLLTRALSRQMGWRMVQVRV